MTDDDDNVFKGLMIAIPFGVAFWAFVIWMVRRG